MAHTAHPHVQGTYLFSLMVVYTPGSSPRTGNIRFLTRVNTRKQPENTQFPCIEMSRQFLVYGGHTSNEAWVLTLRRPTRLIGLP